MGKKDTRAQPSPKGYVYCECPTKNWTCQCHAQVHYVGTPPDPAICDKCAKNEHPNYTG